MSRPDRAGAATPPPHRWSDDDALFRDRATVSGFREDDRDGSLYRRILGSAFDALPPRVRELHDAFETRRWRGSARVERGTGFLARIIGVAMGFPDATADVPVTVTFVPERGGERWIRDFGGKVFTSVQSAGAGRDHYLLVERFGIVRVSLALVRDRQRLFFVPRRWSVLGIPMPGRLLPSGASFETETDGRFSFDITIQVPLIGLIVAYRGSLEP
ncbi:DUF4166 domain-containing protein [Methylobacterium sp. 77]|uniref:DUF4166 domain-containing protein n=1 Tax=Methylobacterium sp. 77 TaxID=1101192 RepID=UPI00037EE35F|nr:DUF4166 domain-containing protein [Methylobacterium sp. 77]